MNPCGSSHTWILISVRAAANSCVLRPCGQVQAPAALATVSGEEDLDILGILPPVAAIAFVYLFVAPVREPSCLF